jgi:hypothetical protein
MEPLKKQSFSLKSNCKLRLLKDMIGGVRNAHPTALCFLLIIDAGTLRVISSALKMIELMEEGVTAIEKLDLVRKKFPKMHAVYFLSPTEDSVDKLIKDYADPKAPQYGSVHVFFTNHVPNHLFQRVASNKNLVSRVLTLKEFNLDFLCSGDTLFHFDLPQALPVIFSKANTPEEKELSERVGHKLASVIPSLFNYSTVQIVFNKSENNMIAEKVARIAAQRIDQILAAKKPDEDSGDAPHTKIIVLERSFDPLTPLLHDYYYQPMVYDLLNINNDIVEYDMTSDSGEVKKKKVILGDNDDLWEQFRFRHISEAMTGITDKFNDFVKSNSTAKMQRGELGEMNLDKMSEIIRSMPQYNELLSKYTMHMNLIDKCLEVRNFESQEFILISLKILVSFDQIGIHR